MRVSNVHAAGRVARGMITLLVLLASVLGMSSFGLSASLAVVAIVLGVPHGALDLEDATNTWSELTQRRHRSLFAAGYAACVLVTYLAWQWWPVAGLYAFVAVSVVHFGQSDLQQDLGLSARRQLPRLLTRGVAVVFLPLLQDPSQANRVIHMMTGGNVPSFVPESAAPGLVAGLSLAYAILWIAPTWRAGPRRVVEETGLLAVLVLAPPLLGFAAYFALWHAPSHLLAVAQRIRLHNAGDALRAALHRAWWTSATALAAVIIGGLVTVLRAPASDAAAPSFVAGGLVVVAALTLPHAILVVAIEHAARRRRGHVDARTNRTA